MSYTAIVLAGGQASRLGSIAANQPKCMLRFCETPFIELLISKLFREKCAKAIIVLGHLAHITENHIMSSSLKSFNIVSIRQAGGTLPALLSGLTQIGDCTDMLCVNADTILDINYRMVIEQHRQSACQATLVTTELTDVPNFGAVEVTSNNIVNCFSEGQAYKNQNRISDVFKYVSNCGCYCFNVSTACNLFMRCDGTSLERHALPLLVRTFPVFNLSNGLKSFIDYGTPDSLDLARRQTELIRRVYYLD